MTLTLARKTARTLAAASLAALCALATAPAAADVGLSATFRDPTGTVGPGDVIDVWITLTSTGSDPFTFDLNEDFPYGLAPGAEPLVGNNPALGLFGVPFDSYTGAGLFTFRFCEDTFEGCGTGGAYVLTTPFASPDVWFNVMSPFSLAPGATLDVLFGQLSPVGGNAAPGVYQLFNYGVGLSVTGLSLDGVTLRADAFAVSTCAGLLPGDCSFDRTVVAVIPEPASLLLMLGGLGAVAAWTGRRQRSVSLNRG